MTSSSSTTSSRSNTSTITHATRVAFTADATTLTTLTTRVHADLDRDGALSYATQDALRAAMRAPSPEHGGWDACLQSHLPSREDYVAWRTAWRALNGALVRAVRCIRTTARTSHDPAAPVPIRIRVAQGQRVLLRFVAYDSYALRTASRSMARARAARPIESRA